MRYLITDIYTYVFPPFIQIPSISFPQMLKVVFTQICPLNCHDRSKKFLVSWIPVIERQDISIAGYHSFVIYSLNDTDIIEVIFCPHWCLAAYLQQ